MLEKFFRELGHDEAEANTGWRASTCGRLANGTEHDAPSPARERRSSSTRLARMALLNSAAVGNAGR